MEYMGQYDQQSLWNLELEFTLDLINQSNLVLRDWKRAFSLAHPSVSACASVSTGSHLEVCDVSSTEAEEATEEKERSVPSVSASVEHPLVLPSPFSWFTLER